MVFGIKIFLISSLFVLFFILCNNNPQDQKPLAFEIKATASDSVIAVRCTLTVTADADSFETEDLLYCWLREGSWVRDTTAEPVYRTLWQFPDTGIKRIVLWAIDPVGKNIISHKDTIYIRVVCFKPQVSVTGPQYASVNDAVVLKAVGTDRDGGVERFEWLVGSRNKKKFFSDADSLIVYWTIADTGEQKVFVWATDNDGLRSVPDSLTVSVIGSQPYIITLSGNTSVSVNDTVRIYCSAYDRDGKVEKYQWSVDMPHRMWFSSPSDTFIYMWRMPDSGMHIVRCRVVDDDGLYSDADSIAIYVSALAPRLSVDYAPLATVNDSTTFTLHPADDDGSVVGFRWLIIKPDGPLKMVSTDTILTVVWRLDDVGRRVVEVTAVDDDSIYSETVRCTVQVIDAVPRMTPFADTMLSVGDTLLITRTFIDTSRRAQLYFWDTGGDGWDDSTVSPQYRIFFTGKSRVTVVTGVRDTLGYFYKDTMIVLFNTPPVIEHLSLSERDTIWVSEGTLPGNISFYGRFYDADKDSLTAYIVWGYNPDTVFCCRDTGLLRVDSIGKYHWLFCVSDTRGQKSIRNGSVFVGEEHTICFAGHSIVAGYAGDNVSGGFRAGILASLRDSIGDLERVRAVGPLTTGHMSGLPVDDSCFAISGSQAREMQLLMDHAYTNLTADIWVVMFGVNGGFSDNEMKATTAMLNRMITRNPKARLYVLLSPPFSSQTNVQRRYYNRNIVDTVAALRSAGFAVSIVRSDSVLWNPSDTNTANTSLFADSPPLHPNQEGYNLLRDEILNVMWNSIPRVLPAKQEEQ